MDASTIDELNYFCRNGYTYNAAEALRQRTMVPNDDLAICAHCGDPIDADDGGDLCMRCWREQRPEEDWQEFR
jgi:hypothetical protein